MSENIIKSILDMIVLQSIWGGVHKDRILNTINSKFNATINSTIFNSTISSLYGRRLIIYNSDNIIALTEKGETLRQQLIEDYLRLQEKITINF